MLDKNIQSWYDENSQQIKDLAKELWELSETALEEYKSCELTAKYMKKHGFEV